jgi:hypothetical protein
VQLVEEAVAVAPLRSKNSPVTISAAGPNETAEARPDMGGQRIHQKRASEFHGKLEQDFEHSPVTMALSGSSEKAGKASPHPRQMVPF